MIRKDDIYTYQNLGDQIGEQFQLHIGKYSMTIQHEMSLLTVGEMLEIMGREIQRREKE